MKMNFLRKAMKKDQKNQGQVLVILALVLVALVAIIGLAVDTGYVYVSYARLSKAVDAAGLAATGEFKRPGGTSSAQLDALTDRMVGAAKQQLYLNGLPKVPDASGYPIVAVEWCHTNPIAVLCKDSTGTYDVKKVRITVTEMVPTFFLAVIGFRQIPITVQSYSQAASVDVVVVLDSSESMTYDAADGSADLDPKTCNPHGCQPFEKVKSAAKAFADNVLFSPYDRMSVVSFNQYASMAIKMSDDLSAIDTAIDNLLVFQPLRCPYTRDTLQAFYGTTDITLIPAPPTAADPGYTPFFSPGDPRTLTTCRFLDKDGVSGSFQYMDCPLDYGPSATQDRSHCGSSDPAAGIATGGNILQGIYTNVTSLDPSLDPDNAATWPEKRDQSLWVMVFLGDGSANSAYACSDAACSGAISICPRNTWPDSWGNPYCQDKNADESTRHEEFLSAGVRNPAYDADDAARDAFDAVTNDGAIIFTVGLSSTVHPLKNGLTVVPSYPAGLTLAPGTTLMGYPFANKISGDISTTKLPNAGEYKFAADGSSLTPIFLAIANKIATRLIQ